MKWITVSPKPFLKSLEVPYSKSYLNRLLILASLRKGTKTIQNYSPAQDVIDMMAALRAIGVSIEEFDKNLTISNSFPDCELDKITEVDIGEGGTTARFLLSLLARGKQKYRLSAKGRLNERPFHSLVSTLKELGAQIEHESNACFPLIIQGPLKIPDALNIDAHETTQFVSSLMLALSDHRVAFKYEAVQSKVYIDLTKKLIQESHRNQFKAAPDFSSAAYPLCLALLNGEVTLTNIFERDFHQADSFLLTLFDQLNITYSWSQAGLYLNQQSNFMGFELDVSQCLDLIPALSFIASYAQSPTIFRSVSKLKNKESDRLHEIQSLLREFEVKYDYNTKNDTLTIQGRAPRVAFKKIKTAPDHRMVMTAYLFLRHNSGGELAHSDCVSKSFPGFFELMQ